MIHGKPGVIAAALLTLSAARAEAATLDERALDGAVEEAFAFSKARLADTLSALQRAHPDEYLRLYPISTETSGRDLGAWKYAGASDWRSGFFPGALWQIYRKTGDALVFAQARAWTASIEGMKNSPIDYDLGNRFMSSFGQGYRMSTGRAELDRAYRRYAREVLLSAAASLDTRFDMGGIEAGALRALDTYMAPYPVYIDGLMNLELLFEGYRFSGRPSRGPARAFYDHAVASARTTMEQNVRADGSTYHIVQHNDGTHGTAGDGGVYAKITDQGYGNETTWSRGQAWALYGLTVVYRYTKDDAAAAPARFLDAARKTADYFISHLPNNHAADGYNHVDGDFVPPTDFDAALGEPAGPYNDANHDHVYGDRQPPLHAFTPRDSSAAAIAASGLFELSTLARSAEEQERYRLAAEEILRSLLTFRGADGKLVYLAKDSPHRGLLAHGVVAFGYPESSLSYGDYYLLEAMNRYQALRAGRPLVSGG